MNFHSHIRKLHIPLQVTLLLQWKTSFVFNKIFSFLFQSPLTYTITLDNLFVSNFSTRRPAVRLDTPSDVHHELHQNLSRNIIYTADCWLNVAFRFWLCPSSSIASWKQSQRASESMGSFGRPKIRQMQWCNLTKPRKYANMNRYEVTMQ